MLILSLLLQICLAAPIKTVVMIGDSLTEGYGVTRDEAYPAKVQLKIAAAKKPWKVTNAGVSGSTAASAPARVTWILKSKPDLILLALGANDGLRGTPVKAVEPNLDRALAQCHDAHVPVLLVGIRVPPNYGAKYSAEFKAMYDRLARAHAVPLLPFLLEGVAGVTKLNQTDGIHPNAAGHKIVADTVYAALEKLL